MHCIGIYMNFKTFDNIKVFIEFSCIWFVFSYVVLNSPFTFGAWTKFCFIFGQLIISRGEIITWF